MAGDAQSVSDLLPRPALFPGGRDVVRFDPLSQAMERQRGAKPNCRVIRRDILAELFDVHACQFRLTSLVCQPKLTQQIAVLECPRWPGRGHESLAGAVAAGPGYRHRPGGVTFCPVRCRAGPSRPDLDKRAERRRCARLRCPGPITIRETGASTCRFRSPSLCSSQRFASRAVRRAHRPVPYRDVGWSSLPLATNSAGPAGSWVLGSTGTRMKSFCPVEV